MIQVLDDMPEGVIGFEASGKLAADDYRKVILPALVKAAESGEVRFLIVMLDFQGMTGGALWLSVAGFQSAVLATGCPHPSR